MINELSHHIFWFTSRAAGIGALLFASASVAAGLLMGGRIVKGNHRMGQMRVVHETLTQATIAAIVLHGGALLGDAWLRPTLSDLLVPFAGPYRPVWNGLGIIGGWLLVVLGLSYYARSRIGVARWRKLHRFAAIGWLLGIGHALGAGTDAGQLWFLAMLSIAAGPPLVLLLARVSGGWLSFGKRSARPARAPAIPPAFRPIVRPALAPTGCVPPIAVSGPTTDDPILAGLLVDGEDGMLVVAGDPSRLSTGTADSAIPPTGVSVLNGGSVPWFLVQVSRRSPADAVLHAICSPKLAPAVAARLNGRLRWQVHTVESRAAWWDFATSIGAAARNAG